MSAVRVTILCLGVVLSVPAAEQAPKLRLAEVQSVSPTRYRAELKLDPDQQQFSGTIEIDLDVQKPLTTLWLNASNLAIGQTSLTAAGTSRAPQGSTSGTTFASV